MVSVTAKAPLFIVGTSAKDTFTSASGGSGQLAIRPFGGGDTINISATTSTTDKIAFEGNGSKNGTYSISGFESNDSLNFALFLGSGNSADKVYDADENTGGVQHVLANNNNPTTVTGKVVVVNGTHNALDESSEIAGLFGADKALSLGNGGKAVVITTQTDNGTFRIWFVHSQDSNVQSQEVTLVGVVTLSGTTYGSGQNQFTFAFGNFCFTDVSQLF